MALTLTRSLAVALTLLVFEHCGLWCCSRDRYDRVVDAIFHLPMPDVGLPPEEALAGTPAAAQARLSYPLSHNPHATRNANRMDCFSDYFSPFSQENGNLCTCRMVPQGCKYASWLLASGSRQVTCSSLPPAVMMMRF